MAGTGDNNTTSDSISDDAWWFLNPELAWLASRELVFVSQWTDGSKKAAEKFLRDGLSDGWLPWHGEIEMDADGTQLALMARANLPLSFVAIRRGLWRRDYPGLDWESSSTVYVGPL